MAITNLPGANIPYAPFTNPVPLIVAAPDDPPLVCIQVNIDWLPYIIGCCFALRAASTWNSDDENAVAAMQDNADELIAILGEAEACPVSVQFRVNPVDGHLWDYSNDGGTTWLAGPDTAQHFTPVFTADGGAPGGYDLSVNGGVSSGLLPLLTASDPDAVVKDPASLLANLITASAGADGLAIQALASIGVWLVKNNGVALALNKIPGLGLATSALEQLSAGSDYTYNLIEVE
jgi:hypothetical protein